MDDASWNLTNYRVEAGIKVDAWDPGTTRIGLIVRFIDTSNYYWLNYYGNNGNVIIQKKVPNSFNSAGNVNIASKTIPKINLGQYYTFGFEVEGNTLRAYLNGEMILECQDNDESKYGPVLQSGKPGIHTFKQSAYFDDVKVIDLSEPEEPAPEEPSIVEILSLDPITVTEGTDPQDIELPDKVNVKLSDDTTTQASVVWNLSNLDTSVAGQYTLEGDVEDTDLNAYLTVLVVEEGVTVLLREEFESYETGAVLDNWVVNLPGEAFWNILDEGNNKVYYYSTDNKMTFLYLNDDSYNSLVNYKIEGLIKVDQWKAPSSNQRVGLVLRFADRTRYYWMHYDYNTKNIKIYKRVGESGVQVAQTPSQQLDLNAGEYYKLGFEAIENRLIAYLNGEPVLEWTDNDDPIYSGKVGLYSFHRPAKFDNITITTKDMDLQDIIFGQQTYELKAGKTHQTAVSAVYGEDAIIDVTNVAVYSSENSGVATVDNSGLISAVAEGETTIKATYSGKETTAVMKVLPPSVITDIRPLDDIVVALGTNIESKSSVRAHEGNLSLCLN